MLQIPAIWPPGTGELSGSDGIVGPVWPEAVLRTRSFRKKLKFVLSHPNWIYYQPLRIDNKASSPSKMFLYDSINTYSRLYLSRTRLSWSSLYLEPNGFSLGFGPYILCYLPLLMSNSLISNPRFSSTVFLSPWDEITLYISNEP